MVRADGGGCAVGDVVVPVAEVEDEAGGEGA